MAVVSGGGGRAGAPASPGDHRRASWASHTNLDERLVDELKELAHTFDQMLDRLDTAFVSQRRFVANASHEVRTPLTIMRTAIDVALAKPDRTTG